ncbi:dispanin subfamily A member 2b-like [Carcharodon carcharias]|uniref:dispanin subfamily A member 2b-like n=1 Tax=Carcharodon carcharias TaxID=13397 RepID=UPI001B7DF7A7|nr:dispanin subfamily A member 2b-like [Carcharodon carcharias]
MEYRADQVIMNPGTYPYQGQQQVQTTVVNVAPNVLPVRDHLLWSIFNFFYLNFCCLGFVALVFSVKSRDRKVVGDAEGARQYASTARALNIATTVLSILVFVIFIALLFAGIISLGNINQHQLSYAAGK